MSHLRALGLRLAGLFDKARKDRELSEELESHLQMHIEDSVRSGMNTDEARRQALIQLGGLEQTKERCRERRSFLWLESLLQDVRFGARMLRQSPGFTAVAVLTLALGIGANTAIFSIVNGVILRPLGYPKPEQLMHLSTQFPTLGLTGFWVSPPEYMEFREINRSFADIGSYTTGEVNLGADDRPLRVRSASVDEHLLRVLGLKVAQGRTFGQGETEIAGPPPTLGQPPPEPAAIAILSHELWQTAFGGRPIVGESVDVNGRHHEVIGIMLPGADVMDNRTRIWLPLGLNPANRQNRANHSLYLVGRLKDGVTLEAAQAELNALIENWGERVGITPGAGAGSHVFVPLNRDAAHILQMTPVQEQIIGGAAQSIWVLQAAVAFVLLIACANLANLLLARAETRQHEFAVRRALGASRGRLLRYFVTEGVLLSIVGGAVGVLVAHLCLQALIRAYPTSVPRQSEVVIDPTVLLFTMGISTVTGLMFGIAPMTHVKSLASVLKKSGTRGSTSATYVRRVLVVVEVALAVVLVTGAGLLLKTVDNLANVDAGFDRSRLITFSMTLPAINYPQPVARAQMYQRLLANLRRLPSVQSATAMSGLPPGRPPDAQDMDVDNYTAPPDGPPENVDYYQNVMSDYFETMGIPIVQGRGFQPADAASSGMVAVVNKTFADTFWKGQNPIGQRLRPCCFPGAASSSDRVPWFTVVGVAKDIKQGGVDQETGTEFYELVDQRASFPPPFAGAPATMNVVVRTNLPPAALSPSLERVVRDIDRTVPIVRLREMEDVFAESIQRRRLLSQLLEVFAGLALVLAAIGIYGVFSYVVTEQRREIGIRMAVGAHRGTILKMVIGGSIKLALIGVAIGIAGALVLTRFVSGLLFGITATDPETFAAVTLVLLAAVLMACYIPARRATKVDPMVALRYE